MDDNNKNTIQEEMNERLDSNEENINNLVKKNTALEKQLAKISQIKIPDYSEAIDMLTHEVRQSRENDQSSQLLGLLHAINNKLDKAPKSAIKQLRILLFPEVNPGQYYKIVFGRLIPWGFCFVAITYLYILGGKAVDAYGRQKQSQQSAHYERAWLNLQQHAGKKMLSAMDQAYDKTAEK